MQKEIKIFSGDQFSVYFSLNKKQSSLYDFRFDFGKFSFTVNYGKYRKEKTFVTDYLHETLKKDGNLKEEKIALDWAKKNYDLGLKRIVISKDPKHYGRITLV